MNINKYMTIAKKILFGVLLILETVVCILALLLLVQRSHDDGGFGLLASFIEAVLWLLHLLELAFWGFCIWLATTAIYTTDLGKRREVPVTKRLDWQLLVTFTGPIGHALYYYTFILKEKPENAS